MGILKFLFREKKNKKPRWQVDRWNGIISLTFLAAALKASRWGISGFAALMRCISSLSIWEKNWCEREKKHIVS